MKYLIGWTGPYNSMDGSAEMMGFMRTLSIVKSISDVEREIDKFKQEMMKDGASPDFHAEQEDGWYFLYYSDCAWIAYKEVKTGCTSCDAYRRTGYRFCQVCSTAL